MDPINYLGMVPQIDLGQKFLTGLQVGAGIGEIQQQTDARQLALQQKQVAMQRAAQYQADVGAALSAPMDQQPQLFAALSLRNPEQYEAINKSFGALSADQQKNELRDTYGIILFQEQVLEVAHLFAGMPLQDADEFRRLMSRHRDRTEMEAMRGKFVAAAIEAHSPGASRARSPVGTSAAAESGACASSSSSHAFARSSSPASAASGASATGRA